MGTSAPVGAGAGGYRDSLAALEGAQKSRRGVSYYTSHVNRPLGRRVAAAAHVLRLTPDQLTLLSGLCSLVGIAVLAVPRPSPVSGLLGAGALVAGFVLDSADGQLARLRHGGSATGELLDHLLDCLVKMALHAAVLVSWYRFSDTEDRLLLVPLSFLAVAVLLFFAGTLVGKLREQTGDPRPVQPGNRPRLTGAGLTLLDHGVICAVFVLWGAQDVFTVVYVCLFAAHVLGLVIFLRRWFGELGRVAG